MRTATRVTPPRNASAVMAMLMQPIADAELADRELERLEARAKKEAQERADNRWHLGNLAVMAAKHNADFWCVQRLTHKLNKSEGLAAMIIQADRAAAEWRKQVFRQIMTPAALPRHIAWKREKLKCLNVPDYADRFEKLRVMIDAEELSFRRKSKKH